MSKTRRGVSKRISQPPRALDKEEEIQSKHELLRNFLEVHHGFGEAVEFDFVADFRERVSEHVSSSAQVHVSVAVGDEVA